MPDQLVVLIAIAGIVLVGLAFTAIDLVKDAGRLIGLGLLAFLAILMLNRTLPSTETANPGTYPITPSPYPSASRPSPYPNTNPITPPNSSDPTFNPNSPAPGLAPNLPRRTFPSFDSAYQGFSDFVQRTLTGIDEFVYGNPYSVGQQPVTQPPAGQQPAQEPAQRRLEPTTSPEQGYQIRPDGVPSRVSTLVESPSGQTNRSLRPSTTRPVSALW